MSMRPIVPCLVVAFAALLFAAPAVAGPSVTLPCPAEARGTVSHTGDAAWVATTQSSRVVLSSVEQIGGQPALVCTYRMFGGDYWIYRRPPAEYPHCTRSSGPIGFFCRPTP
jgi:hypothetical protein